jgi:hypothetical protein
VSGRCLLVLGHATPVKSNLEAVCSGLRSVSIPPITA